MKKTILAMILSALLLNNLAIGAEVGCNRSYTEKGDRRDNLNDAFIVTGAVAGGVAAGAGIAVSGFALGFVMFQIAPGFLTVMTPIGGGVYGGIVGGNAVFEYVGKQKQINSNKFYRLADEIYTSHWGYVSLEFQRDVEKEVKKLSPSFMKPEKFNSIIASVLSQGDLENEYCPLVEGHEVLMKPKSVKKLIALKIVKTFAYNL
jgi:hypothetical protein